MPLTAQLVTLFAEANSPSHIGSAEVDAALPAAMDFATTLQRQIAHSRALLLQAQLANRVRAGALEPLEQTLGCLERDLKAFVEAGRALGVWCAQWERYGADVEVQEVAAAEKADAVLAAASAAGLSTAPPVL